MMVWLLNAPIEDFLMTIVFKDLLRDYLLNIKGMNSGIYNIWIFDGKIGFGNYIAFPFFN